MAARSEKKVTKKKATRAKKVTEPTKAPLKKSTKSSTKTLAKSSTKKSTKKSTKDSTENRYGLLKQILIDKREAIIQEIKHQLGQSVTEEQQRRLEAAMDSGDQALVDLEREMGISLQEMRNRERQLIDDALASLDEGTYGICAECGEEISDKRLQALPFARLCVACQSKLELMEKIERAEQRS